VTGSPGGAAPVSLAGQIVRSQLNRFTTSDPTPGSEATVDHRAPASPSVISGLSVDEWLLVEDAGYEPCGVVAGAAVFHIGLVGTRAGNSEMEMLSSALLDARERAAASLRREAEELGASGVVGVRLTIEALEGKSHLVRVIASGTGIRPIHPPAESHDRPPPFLSALSGQEFSVLASCGYIPVAMVMGVCVYHVGRQTPRAWVRNRFRNFELGTYTAALYQARERAMVRLQGEARAAGAEGVVGVTTSELSHVWGSHIIEFFAMGTAVRSSTDGHPWRPTFALSLRDPVVLTDPSAITGAP
jgi:uncharacterized protein YbjQ (UPF0145 family)